MVFMCSTEVQRIRGGVKIYCISPSAQICCLIPIYSSGGYNNSLFSSACSKNRE